MSRSLYELATWPHGVRAGRLFASTCQHEFGQQPAADGRIYQVCRKCGLALGSGNLPPKRKPKEPKGGAKK